MKIFDTLYFMPALVCMLWVITFIITEKTHRQKVLLACLVVGVPCMVTYGLWTIPNTDYKLFVSVERFSLPLTMMLIAMISIYLNVHITGKKVNIAHTLLLAPGLMYSSALDTLYYIIGTDKAAQLYDIVDKGGEMPAEFTTKLYKAFLFLDVDMATYLAVAFISIIFCECIYIIYKGGYSFGDYTRFLLKKKEPKASLVVALCMLLFSTCASPVFISPRWVPQHPTTGLVLALVLAIVLHILCIAEYHSNINGNGNRNEDINGNVNIDGNGSVSDEEEEKAVENIMGDETGNNSEEEDGKGDVNIDSVRMRRATSMFNGFARLMIEEKIYLNPDLTVADVAEKLMVGRSTLSNMINHEYGKTFRSVLNDYRIYYAKQFMLDNPRCTQETIALKCGFKDASAFSHKFKEMVGISPLMWLASQSKKEEE